MPYTPARQFPKEQWLVAGPFRGMRDAPEITAHEPDLALYAGNLCRVPGPPNAGLTGRPGFDGMGSTALGSGSTRATQALLTWTDYNGVRITVAIVGGKIYTYNWNSSAWTESVTGANLSSVSVTLSSTTRVALVPFADGLVVSDGANTPFWWDGTAGAGGLVKLTNAPVFYGPPTVRDSRLLGIKAANRNTFVYSEPGQPNVGYEAGGYNNAWDNPGGYSDPMTVVVGTNEALYVFRERIALAIVGNVTADWATSGTRANLSPDVGTVSPWAAHVVSRGVIIVDADAQPWLFRLGDADPTPMWNDCRQTVRGTPRVNLGNVQIVQDDSTYSILIGYPEVGETDPTIWVCFSQEDLQCTGVWFWPEAAQRAGRIIDGNGVARWAHAGVDDGRLYVHGDLESGPWNDALQSGVQYIQHSLIASALGYDLDRELVIDQIEAAITGTGVTQVAVSYETPRGQSVPLNVSVSVQSAALQWDVDDWDEANWAGATRDQRIRVGTRGLGRWVRPKIAHAENDEPFGVSVVRVRTFAQPGNPRVP